MILALLACSGPDLTDGLPNDLVSELTTCTYVEGEHRDACALEVLERLGLQVEGRTMGVVCDRMGSGSSQDRCYELAVRTHNVPADVSNCAKIDDELLGYSCVLADADRRMAGTLDEALEACRKTGPLFKHCATHLGTHRLDTWSELGLSVMRDEVQAVLEAEPDLAFDSDFGYSIGYATWQLGQIAGVPGPCDAFPYGDGKMACETVVMSPNRGHQRSQGGQGGQQGALPAGTLQQGGQGGMQGGMGQPGMQGGQQGGMGQPGMQGGQQGGQQGGMGQPGMQGGQGGQQGGMGQPGMQGGQGGQGGQQGGMGQPGGGQPTQSGGATFQPGGPVQK